MSDDEINNTFSNNFNNEFSFNNKKIELDKQDQQKNDKSKIIQSVIHSNHSEEFQNKNQINNPTNVNINNLRNKSNSPNPYISQMNNNMIGKSVIYNPNNLNNKNQPNEFAKSHIHSIENSNGKNKQVQNNVVNINEFRPITNFQNDYNRISEGSKPMQNNYGVQNSQLSNQGINQNNIQVSQVSNNQGNQSNKKVLYDANELFKKGVKLSQQFCYLDAIECFNTAKATTISVYDKLGIDPTVKSQMDHFLKALDSQLSNMQILCSKQYSANPSERKMDFTSDLERVFNKEKSKSPIKSNVVKSVQSQSTNKKVVTSENKSKDFNNNNKDNNVKEEKNKQTSNVPDELKERILNEIVDTKPDIKFDDVIGLMQAKQIINEIIVYPNLRPDLFVGLRSPPRGLLLFGPPGTGKTMLAKAIATECKCTFFNISAASLTGKYVGESEKLVRALFELAFEKEPAVVFIDEIDSILSKRGDNDNEASIRLKTEFLVQFDGVGSNNKAKVLIIGATNRPMELDSAVLRRLPKRVYVGAFNKEERVTFLKHTLSNQENDLNENDFYLIAEKTNNYTNSDLKELCREAAYGPIRDINPKELMNVKSLRPVNVEDMLNALKKVRGILNEEILKSLEDWDKNYGAVV